MRTEDCVTPVMPLAGSLTVCAVRFPGEGELSGTAVASWGGCRQWHPT
jgi:hypothetical protein